jgi:hypothetical protein
MFAALNTIEGRVVDAVRMLAELAVSCYGSVPGLVDAPGSRLVELQRGPVQLGLRARGEIVALREVLTEDSCSRSTGVSCARASAPGSAQAAAVPLPWRRYVTTKLPNRPPFLTHQGAGGTCPQ